MALAGEHEFGEAVGLIVFGAVAKVNVEHNTIVGLSVEVDGFSFKVRNIQEFSLSPLLFNIVQKVLTRAIRQENKVI